jgi:hypothetical protein
MTSLESFMKGTRTIGAYFESWSANWASSGETHDLVKINNSINIIYLSFVHPNCSYTKGSNTFTGTGLQFSSDFTVIKNAIKILRNKGCIVMLSVGGATYHFDVFNPVNIANLVYDLDCDGVDIDWEDPQGTVNAHKFGPIISKMRDALPNKFISTAGFSVGAYGEGEFKNAKPLSSYTGMNIAGLREQGSKLDWINIMSYDASSVYDPIIAYRAYKSFFNGPVMIGVEVPPEAWGGHILTLDEVRTFSNYLTSSNLLSEGLFVWSYQKNGYPSCIDIVNVTKPIFSSKPPTPTPVTPVTPIQPPVPTPFPFPTPVTPPVVRPPTPVTPTVVVPPTPVTPVSQKWEPNKLYKNGATVQHNNIEYKCNVSAIASAFSPDTIIWKPVLNEWKSGIAYKVGDIVSYNGLKYKCLTSHTSIVTWYPVDTPTLWQKN